MIYMEKAKRKPKTQEEVLSALLLMGLSRTVLVLAVIFSLIVINKLVTLFVVYATVTGVLMTFFWPVVFSGVMLLMLANQYVRYGQPIKAYAARLVFCALVITALASIFVATALL